MSKQTQLYVVGSWLDNKDSANYGTAGIGNSATFQNVGATVLRSGRRHQALVLIGKHFDLKRIDGRLRAPVFLTVPLTARRGG